MKTKGQILTVLFIVLCQSGHAQGFVDLDFEDAAIVQDTSSPYYPYAIYASNAMPGWSVTNYFGPNDILYNDVSLGAPSVSLFETNGSFHVLDGSFSVDLYGGSIGASISQTALVPGSALSLSFKAQSAIGTLLVSLGGQDLPFFALATGSNFTLYGANIPVGFAGQSEQLLFSALEGNNNNWILDDIQFSSTVVPEPSEFALGALGALLLGFRRWRNSFAANKQARTVSRPRS